MLRRELFAFRRAPRDAMSRKFSLSDLRAAASPQVVGRKDVRVDVNDFVKRIYWIDVTSTRGHYIEDKLAAFRGLRRAPCGNQRPF